MLCLISTNSATSRNWLWNSATGSLDLKTIEWCIVLIRKSCRSVKKKKYDWFGNFYKNHSKSEPDDHVKITNIQFNLFSSVHP